MWWYAYLSEYQDVKEALVNKEGVTMSVLFEPFTIKKLEIRNRFVRSATYDGFANEDSSVSDSQIKIFSELADGGIGLIISGIAYVHHTGQISPRQNSITGDEFIPGFEKLTKMLHDRGAKIAIQLFHGGREASPVNYSR